MLIEINTDQSFVINWSARGIDRIIQNAMNLLNTKTYEIAYARMIGLSRKFIDLPLEKAVAQATVEIIDCIETFEPRVKVEKVEYIGVNNDGIIDFKVVIRI